LLIIKPLHTATTSSAIPSSQWCTVATATTTTNGELFDCIEFFAHRLLITENNIVLLQLSAASTTSSSSIECTTAATTATVASSNRQNPTANPTPTIQGCTSCSQTIRWQNKCPCGYLGISRGNGIRTNRQRHIIGYRRHGRSTTAAIFTTMETQ
jgi:hypothetical protein